VRFIDGWVMPSLLRGKLPTVHDDKMLFLGPKATLAIAAQVELAAWARDVNNRSASSAEEIANPAYPQQTLQYVLTKTAKKLPATLKTGRPQVEHTFQTGTHIGRTLPQVLHSNAAYFYYLLGEGPGDKNATACQRRRTRDLHHSPQLRVPGVRASASTVHCRASCRWSSNSSASGTRRRPT
jgi:hypothetical protein